MFLACNTLKVSTACSIIYLKPKDMSAEDFASLVYKECTSKRRIQINTDKNSQQTLPIFCQEEALFYNILFCTSEVTRALHNINLMSIQTAGFLQTVSLYCSGLASINTLILLFNKWTKQYYASQTQTVLIHPALNVLCIVLNKLGTKLIAGQMLESNGILGDFHLQRQRLITWAVSLQETLWNKYQRSKGDFCSKVFDRMIQCPVLIWPTTFSLISMLTKQVSSDRYMLSRPSCLGIIGRILQTLEKSARYLRNKKGLNNDSTITNLNAVILKLFKVEQMLANQLGQFLLASHYVAFVKCHFKRIVSSL